MVGVRCTPELCTQALVLRLESGDLGEELVEVGVRGVVAHERPRWREEVDDEESATVPPVGDEANPSSQKTSMDRCYRGALLQ